MMEQLLYVHPSAIVAVYFRTQKDSYSFYQELHDHYSDYLQYAFNWIASVQDREWVAQAPVQPPSSMVSFNIYSRAILPEMDNILRLIANIYESFPGLPDDIYVYVRQNNIFSKFISNPNSKIVDRFVYDLTNIDTLPNDFLNHSDVCANWEYLLSIDHPMYIDGGVPLPAREDFMKTYMQRNNQDEDEVLL